MKQNLDWPEKVINLDERRTLVLPGDNAETLKFCVDHFLHIAKESIEDHGYFAVALSGGTTPAAIFKVLSKAEYLNVVDWRKFLVFWSDERSVPPNDKESNYRTSMESGWSILPVPKENIFRMVAEVDIEKHAEEYEKLILEKIPQRYFDLIMLGMGDDGHTASLFPHTEGLYVEDRLVIANFVPQKNTWRMSFTFACINAAPHIVVYVLGKGKEAILKNVLEGPFQPENYPSQLVGTSAHKALWIADTQSSSLLDGL